MERRRRQHKPRPGASWRGRADARLCSPHLGPGACTAVFTGRINERVFAEQMKSGQALGDPWQQGCQSGPCPVLSPLPPRASPLACFSQDLSSGTERQRCHLSRTFPPGHRPCCRLFRNSRPPVPVQTPPQGLPSFLREGGKEASLHQGLPAARGCRGGPGSLPTRRVCSPEGQTCSGGRHMSWPRGSSQAGGWAPRAAGHSSLSGPRAPKPRGSRERAHSPADRPWRCGPLLFWLQPGLLSSPSPPRAFAPGPQAAAGPPRFTEKDTEAPDVPRPARGERLRQRGSEPGGRPSPR